MRDYDHVIILSNAERIKRETEIIELDKRGMQLKEQILTEWHAEITSGEPVRIKYYSEGLCAYLD